MRLSDILQNNGGNDDLKKLFLETQAAGELAPLPAGEYVAHIVAGGFERSRSKGTPSYKLTFKIIEGEHSGRLFWLDCWLTLAALPQSKRDLKKLGVNKLEQLDQPLPRFMRCICKLALRRDDDDNESNRVKSFSVIGIDKPEEDPFAPGAVASSPTEPATTLPAAAATPPPQTQATEGGTGNGIPF
jgi:hypothetical protein